MSHELYSDSKNGFKTEFEIKYERFLLLQNYGRIGERLVSAVRMNHKQKTKALLKLIESHRLDLIQHIPQGKTLLHDCLLVFGNDDEIFSHLIENHPSLLLTKKEKTQQTVLHIAVARERHKATICILSKIKQTLEESESFMKYLHSPMHVGDDGTWKDTSLEEEIPLSIAVWNIDIETIEILLDYGADLEAVNSKGNNCFHTLVKASARNSLQPHKSLEIFRKLISATRTNSVVPHEVNAIKLSKILNTKNKDGYTPLTMATILLAGSMYQEIINCLGIYKLLDNVHGVSNTYLYDVTDVDSALGHHSVMHHVASQSPESFDDFLLIIDRSPLLDMIRLKWCAYRKWYYIWAVIHLLFCLLPVFSFSNTYSGNLNISQTNCCANHKAVSTEPAFGIWHALLLVYLIYGILILIFECYIFVNHLRNSKKLQMTSFSTACNIPFQIILVLFGCMSLISLSVFFVDFYSFMITLIMSMFFGWCFLLHFTRCFKDFSYFTEILLQGITKNLLQLAVVYIVFLVPFSVAMTAAYSGKSAEFSHFFDSAFMLFHLTTGLSDVTTLDLALHPRLARFIYLSHAVITYVLIFNVLIALLSESAISASKNIDNRWHLQKLNVILFLEDRILSRHRYVCGEIKKSKLFPPENIAMTSKVKNARYYLEVKETSSYKAIEKDVSVDRKVDTGQFYAEQLQNKANLLQTQNNLFTTYLAQDFKNKTDNLPPVIK